MKDIDDILFKKEDQMAIGKKTESKKSTEKKADKPVDKLGIGLDIGTSFLVGASFRDNKISYSPIRDCFYSLDKDIFSKSIFNKNMMKYVESNNKIHIVGEDALTLSKINNSSSLRPLAKGVINPNERSAAPILMEMINFCVSKYKKKDNEKLVFSIPAPMVGNNEGFNVEYHSLSISSLVKKLGFDPVPLNEAYAVIISEMEGAKEITGLGFSFGAGLVNVAFVYKSMLIFEFSINKSGDFIDQESAKACGVSESMINHIKERKLNLACDEFAVSQEERALIFTHRHVIKNAVENVIVAFSNSSVNILDPIPVVISGGTTLPKGFIEMFENEISSANIPFDIDRVIPAEDRLTSVAKGCLLWANMLEDN